MKTNTYDISIVLPTYNERENILTILKEVTRIAHKSHLNVEAIVVDDNSNDGSLKAITSLSLPHVHCISRVKERGLATAIMRGIKESKGKIIIVMDTDLNHDPLLIPKIVRNLKPHSMVIGSRFVKGGGMDNTLRYVASKFYNKYFLSILLQSGVNDNLSGYFAIYKNDLLPYIKKDIFYGYGDYFIRLIYTLKRNNFTFIEVPCYYKNRTYGQSKSKFINMFIFYSLEAIKYVFHKK